MNEKMIFRQLLGELLELAGEQDGRIERTQVEEMLSHAGLTDQQMDLVCDYLREQHVQVEEGEEGLPESGSHILSIYLKELERSPVLAAHTEKELFDRIAKGHEQARQELIQAYLPVVCDLAGELESGGLPAEDLIQEGNLGLLSALMDLEEKESLAAYQADLMNRIVTSMEEALSLYGQMKDADRSMEERVNHMDQAIRNLSEELERKASLEEVSAYLDMPLEEIRSILRLAGDRRG